MMKNAVHIGSKGKKRDKKKTLQRDRDSVRCISAVAKVYDDVSANTQLQIRRGSFVKIAELSLTRFMSFEERVCNSSIL